MDLIFTVNTHERYVSENSSYKGLKDRIRHIGKTGYHCIRINFKQFSKAECDKINTILSAIEEEKKSFLNPVKVYIDIPFPYQKYRAKLNEKCVSYMKGDEISLKNKCDNPSDRYEIVINQAFIKALKESSEIVYADGEGAFKVKEVGEEYAKIVAMDNFEMHSGKSLYSGTLLRQSIPMEFSDFLSSLHKLDNVEGFLFSFCDTGEVKDIFCSQLSQVPTKKYYAKVESIDGVKNIDNLLTDYDGIIIARGDLATMCGVQNFYRIHNYLAEKIMKSNKELIFATDIMMSLVKNSYMNRADLIDISNILSFHPDALILNSDIAYEHRIELVKNNLEKLID